MQMFNSKTRYGAVARVLHWATVLAVAGSWVLGLIGDELPRGAARETGLSAHILLGLLVIALTVLRLPWRLVDAVPPVETAGVADAALSRWIERGAKLAHLALYALLVLVPVIGIVLQFARGDALPLFGLGEIASPWPADRAFARAVKEVHEVTAHGLVALASLHAAAALVHHFLLGDDTLMRMLPPRRASAD